jgi:putative FmdB family regulatory protein
MPIYEYRCPQCNKEKEVILSFKDSDIPQECECGGVMRKLISLPRPAIFIVTNRNRLVNTLNNDEKAYGMVGKPRDRERYKQVIGNSLFNQEKKTIGIGF